MCDHPLWLSRAALSSRLSEEVLDITPRAIERYAIPSRLVLGRRRYCYHCAKDLFAGVIAEAEEVLGTPGAELVKSLQR